jgi:membrane-bound lytic murein transglycosylase MltF
VGSDFAGQGRMNYDAVKKLVHDNNRSKDYSEEFVICLIWKETNFDASAKNTASSATGLMQLTKSAVDQVNRCSPKGIHFQFSDMTDAAKNIQCGTLYLDIAKNKLGGIDKSYGTGPGYSNSIVACEGCLKNGQAPMVALQKIHM